VRVIEYFYVFISTLRKSFVFSTNLSVIV